MPTLRSLEQGGWVGLDGEMAALAHDEMQAAVLESVSEAEAREATLALGQAEVRIGPQDRTGHQRAARLLVTGGDESALVPLFLPWRAGRGLGAEARTAAEAAEQLLGVHATSARVARLRRSGSWRARMAESRVPMVAA